MAPPATAFFIVTWLPAEAAVAVGEVGEDPRFGAKFAAALDRALRRSS